MNAFLSSTPYHTVLNDVGIPIAGAKIWTYSANSSNPKDSYTNYVGDVVQSNPIVADSAGRFELWLGGGLYKIVYTDADDAHIRTIDNVGTSQSGTNACLTVQTLVGSSDSLKSLSAGLVGLVVTLGYRTAGDGGHGCFRWDANASGGDDGETVDGNTSYDLGNGGRWKRLIEGSVSPKWWGAYGNGSNDDKSYFDKAVWYARQNVKSLNLTAGTYFLSSDTTFTSVPVTFEPEAILSFTNFRPDMTCSITDLNQHFISTLNYAPILHTPIYPQWFGAAQGIDNQLSMTLAIQSAAPGELLLTDGTWTLLNSIAPVSNLTIKGEGYSTVITPMLSFASTELIENDTVAVDNFRLTDLTLKGLYESPSNAINILGNNVSIDHVKFDGFEYRGIRVGGTAAVATSNISICDNIFADVGAAAADPSIELKNGSNVQIERNVFTCGSGSDAINAIDIAPEFAALSDLSIKNNIFKGFSEPILMVSAVSPTGLVDISENDISYTGEAATSIGITLRMTANTDAAKSYTVSNNTIQSDATVSVGINLDSLEKSVFADGNAISLSGNDSTGIKETNLVVSSDFINYGVNLFEQVNDKYATSSPRYCYLGTEVKSQIDGDTTINNDLSVTGNIINTNYQQMQTDMSHLLVNGYPGTAETGAFGAFMVGYLAPPFGNTASTDATEIYCTWEKKMADVSMYLLGAWTSGDATISVNGTSYGAHFVHDKTTSMQQFPPLIETNPDVRNCYYVNAESLLVVQPYPGKAITLSGNLGSVVGGMTGTVLKNSTVTLTYPSKILDTDYMSSGDKDVKLYTNACLPATILPQYAITVPVSVWNDTDEVMGCVKVNPAGSKLEWGILNGGMWDFTGFTAGIGTSKGFYGATVTYPIVSGDIPQA